MNLSSLVIDEKGFGFEDLALDGSEDCPQNLLWRFQAEDRGVSSQIDKL
jgi:hypothetical protein